MAKWLVITEPGGPQKGRHQVSRNPIAVLLVVDVSMFSAQSMPVGMLLPHSDVHSTSLPSPLALLADALYSSHMCCLRISCTYLGGFLLEVEEEEVAKPSFPVP